MNYTTLPNLKQWSDLGAVRDDGLIEGLITACSRMVDQHCQQGFGRRTLDSEACAGAVDAYGRLSVWVPAPSVVEVTGLTFRSPARPGVVTVPAADLWWDDQPCGVVLRTDSLSWGHYRGGRLSCRLSGVVGWLESEIPADFELQVRKLVFWAYKRRETAAEKTAIPDLGVVIIPQAWPPDIKDGLKDYVRVTGY